LLAQIEEQQEKEKHNQKLRDNVKRIEAQATPSKALGSAFCNVSIGGPIPAPHFNVPQTFTPHPPFALQTYSDRAATAYPPQQRGP
jgi:hypothetical protein